MRRGLLRMSIACLTIGLVACGRERAGKLPPPTAALPPLEAAARTLLLEHEQLHRRFWSTEHMSAVDLDRMAQIDHDLARLGEEMLKIWALSAVPGRDILGRDSPVTIPVVPQTIPELWRRFVALNEQERSMRLDRRSPGASPWSIRHQNLGWLYDQRDDLRTALKDHYGVHTR